MEKMSQIVYFDLRIELRIVKVVWKRIKHNKKEGKDQESI